MADSGRKRVDHLGCPALKRRLAICAIAFFLSPLPCMQSVAEQIADQSVNFALAGNCLDVTARGLLLRGAFKEAVVELRDAVRRGSTCADDQYMLAYSLLRDNHPEESLSAYTVAARMRKPSSVDLRHVALDYVLLEDYPDARRWIKTALAIDATDAESWYVQGRIQYTTSDVSGAASSFEKALELSPHNVKTENNLGLAYEALNEPAKAAEAYRQAIAEGEESGQSSEQPLMNLANLLAREGDLRTARSLLVQAAAIAPENADVQEHLGHVYLDLNELSEAQLHLEKAVALRPHDGRLHFLLGQAYRRSGMNDRSKLEFALAASLDGTHATPGHLK